MRQGWRNSTMSPHELTPAPAESGQLLISQDGATIRSFRMVRREGARHVTRSIEHHSLDAILIIVERAMGKPDCRTFEVGA